MGAGREGGAERGFKRQCIVSVEPDEATLAHVIDYMGGNNVVFSTDYPHGDSKYPEAVHHFLKLPISEADKKKSFGITAPRTTRCNGAKKGRCSGLDPNRSSAMRI